MSSAAVPLTLLRGKSSTASGSTPQFAIQNKLTKEKTTSRLELSNALVQEYLEAKHAWESQRDKMITRALSLQPLGSPDSEVELAALTRRLAHETASHEAILASKHADAVVRGYSHHVREAARCAQCPTRCSGAEVATGEADPVVWIGPSFERQEGGC